MKNREKLERKHFFGLEIGLKDYSFKISHRI